MDGRTSHSNPSSTIFSHMNDAQEETDDMEWEEVGRQEKLEKARRKKKGWELVRFAKGIVLELGEKAVNRAENKHVSECLEDIVLEGWRRIETGRALRSINNLEKEVQKAPCTPLCPSHTVNCPVLKGARATLSELLLPQL